MNKEVTREILTAWRDELYTEIGLCYYQRETVVGHGQEDYREEKQHEITRLTLRLEALNYVLAH